MEKYYSVAIRPRLDVGDRFYNHQDFLFQEIKLNSKGKYWIADPFIFEKDEEVYIFYELLNLISGVGKIAYSTIDKNGNVTDPYIVIHERGHFSFPYIFEHNGEIYIMPETCGRNAAYCYRAVNFPNKWAKERALIQNEFVVDSIFFDERDLSRIIGSVQYRNPPEGRVISCWVKNVLFEQKDSGQTQQVIQEGEYGIRNAGKIFLDSEGKRIRPGQDCSGGVYGKGLVFWQLDDDFHETEIYHIDADAMQSHIRFMGEKKIVGTHTYNASAHYEIIDFSYYDDIVLSTRINRAIYRWTHACYGIAKKIAKKCLKVVCSLLKN